MSPRVEPPLWNTFRGSPASVGVGWLAWAAAVALFAWATARPFGEAGGVIPVFVLGWMLARRLPDPLDCLRRYHLDDGEIMVLGPGRLVRRIPWGDVQSVTQERATVVLRGRGVARLPLRALREADALAPILVRVVPLVAQTLWTRLERGRIRLRPAVDPAPRPLLWWAWMPAAVACAIAGGGSGAALLAGVVVGERVVGWLLARSREIQLHPRGLTVAGRRRGFLPWSDVMVLHGAEGVGLARPGHAPVFVPDTLRDFWAAAPVIELRAQLGPEVPAEVCFRARLDGGALAVVGEVEAPH